METFSSIPFTERAKNSLERLLPSPIHRHIYDNASCGNPLLLLFDLAANACNTQPLEYPEDMRLTSLNTFIDQSIGHLKSDLNSQTSGRTTNNLLNYIKIFFSGQNIRSSDFYKELYFLVVDYISTVSFRDEFINSQSNSVDLSKIGEPITSYSCQDDFSRDLTSKASPMFNLYMYLTTSAQVSSLSVFELALLTRKSSFVNIGRRPSFYPFNQLKQFCDWARSQNISHNNISSTLTINR